MTAETKDPRVSVVDGVTLETRFRDVLDALFAFVGFFSHEGIVLETNQAPLTASGLQRADVLGHRFVDLPWFGHSAEERARVSQAIARAAQGQPSRFETSVQSGRGGIVAIDAAFAPLRAPDGTIKYIVGTGIDVTVRRRAEEELLRHRARLAEAQRVAHLGSWEWDVGTNRVTWSEELYQIYGVDPRAHVPSYDSFLAAVYLDDREHTFNVLRMAMQNLSPFVYDHRIVRPDGGVRMLHTRGEVVGAADGRVLRLVGSCWDITERWDAMRAAEAARSDAERAANELRALATRLADIREEERREIARELHDQVGQALTALKLDLAVVRGQLAGGALADAGTRLGAMDTLLDETLETTRRISATLRPAILDDLGLAAAIRWQAAEFTQRTGVACEVRVPDAEATMPPAVALALFRILQEALTNVARHAAAHHVVVELARERGAAALTVADDGRGFGTVEVAGRRSLGLMGMRERATALGGQVEIVGPAGRGTTVRARIPAAVSERA
ncbi:MAG TPA: PAS domain S-box protein [Polyangia bacterium]|nr:PAS domain S-box protein [Polyangia bacterium]